MLWVYVNILGFGVIHQCKFGYWESNFGNPICSLWADKVKFQRQKNSDQTEVKSILGELSVAVSIF